MRVRLLSFCALLLGGVGLRLWGLGRDNLWLDEVSTALVAGGPPFSIRLGGANVAPLYYLLANSTSQMGGSELWLRLPAFIAGCLVLPVAFLLGRELAGSRGGLALLALVAANPFLLWYSQEARPYSLFVLAGALSALAIVRLSRGGDRWDSVLLSGSLALGVWSHAYGLFYIVAAALSLALLRIPYRRLATSIGAALLLSAPWLVGILLLPQGQTGGARPFTWAALPYTLYELLLGKSFGPTSFELHTLSVWEIVLHYPVELAAAAALSGASLFLLAGVMRSRLARAMLLFSVAPVLAALLVWLLPLNIAYSARYVAASVVPLLALIAWSAVSGGGLRLGLFSAVAALGLVSALSFQLDPRYRKEDIRGAAQAICASGRGEAVLVSNYQTASVMRYYSSCDLPLTTNPGELLCDRFWVVEARPWEDTSWGGRLDSLLAGSQIERKLTFTGARAWLLERLQ